MKPYTKLLFFSVLTFLSTHKVQAQETSKNFLTENYTKKEVKIEMRDGIKLHATIYAPKDTSKKYPNLIKKNSL